MLALQNSKQDSKTCTVNVLPCKIHHNGPARVTKRYWNPKGEKDGTKTSYFRGRKLQGKVINLPQGYVGALVKPTERVLPQAPKQTLSSTIEDDSDDEVQALEDIPEPVKVLETTARFQEIVVWGHDQTPDHDDAFVKGVDEWLTFANAIHQP